MIIHFVVFTYWRRSSEIYGSRALGGDSGHCSHSLGLLRYDSLRLEFFLFHYLFIIEILQLSIKKIFQCLCTKIFFFHKYNLLYFYLLAFITLYLCNSIICGRYVTQNQTFFAPQVEGIMTIFSTQRRKSDANTKCSAEDFPAVPKRHPFPRKRSGKSHTPASHLPL